ncbi:MAG: formylglycine-generating enzyme family protein [Planctomycetota bacterium]|nr:formylglycine-generating enzyme family protein [Planctomycetota bacterium]
MAEESPGLVGERIRASDLQRLSVHMPETVFLMGCDMRHVAEHIRAMDRARHLSASNIVYATPGVWVHLPSYHIQTRMVTNGEYRRFLQDVGEDGVPIVDRTDLWRYVWDDLAMRVQSVNMPFRQADGTVTQHEEDYRACRNFLQAYVNSIRFECQRLLISGGEPAEEKDSDGSSLAFRSEGDGTVVVSVPRGAVLERLFRLAEYMLRGRGAEEDGDGAWAETAEELAREYPDPASVVRDIDRIEDGVLRAYESRTDRRFRQLLQQKKLEVETVIFLRRFKAAVRKAPSLHAPLSVGEVLYPRYWTSPAGAAGGGQKAMFGHKKKVPWEDLPVVGITVYEAAAYCAWLAERAGADVQLPTEAQMERASSWPQGEGISAEARMTVNPSWKHLFPWQGHNDRDFNFYFGKRGEEIDYYFVPDRTLYEKLVGDTLRPLPDGKSIAMLEGFGWQWTCERYDEAERRYSRFQDPNYPRFERLEVFEEGKEEPVPVYDYKPWKDVQSGFYVLKGSPEILGGPGLTVRRYAAYPLRGYRNVGFRWVVSGFGE